MKILTILSIISLITYTSAFVPLLLIPLGFKINELLKSAKSPDNTPDDVKEQLAKVENTAHQTRVVGGKPAAAHQFPYQVGLLSTCEVKSSSESQWCGGSLITPNYVLTAAHCLHKCSESVLFIGAHDYTDEDEESQQRLFLNSENYIIHENYNPKKVLNDIALVKLPEPVELNNYVKVIELADESFNTVNVRGIISGWGLMTDDEDEDTPDILQYVNVKTISNDVCRRFYPKHITSNNICTDSSKGQATCSGDSGGPFVTRSKSRKYVQIGLTSFGSKKGCESGYPSVYTKVSRYLDWIEKHSDYKVKRN